jgi:NAD-dependent SIR2 family protein deacetylase
MVTQSEIKPAEHIIDLILNRNDNMPNYTFFLGAGASWYSGVKTADEMVEKWRNQLYQRAKTRMRYDNWLSKQSWYNTDDEYGYLFKYLYDERSQRRDYIEKMLESARPAWGYVYLACLLQAQIINAVFTTNFDDLINEACYLYTDGLRPIVCAHDSEVSNVRLTRSRPKIVKLHGDFLFDSIKNTKSETLRLTKNMETKLAQFGQEYGLVVIGYGGRDNSVMSILEKLVTRKDNFKHGIYMVHT